MNLHSLTRVARALVALFCLWVAVPASAEDSNPVAGTWAWKVEDQTIFLISLNAAPATGGWIDGPRSLSLTSAGGGIQISDVQMPVKRKPLAFVEATKTGALYRSVADDPRQAEDYEVRSVPDGSIALLLVGSPLPPLRLERVDDDAEVTRDWNPDRTYRIMGPPITDNLELKALYDADQAARTHGDIDWTIVSRQDAERREIVRTMLDRGEIRSGPDYERAAFIFQHGARPEDYLLAHALASAAVVQGQTSAAWISAATLDRYLQNIGKPQVFGTQFQAPNGEAYSQGSFDRALFPDALRSAMGVPTLEAQAEQLRMMNETRDASTTAP